MTTLQRGPWWRRPLAVMAALAMSGGALAVSAPAASAAPSDILPATAGSLDWGVKESFRKYLQMPFAKGSTTLEGGATSNADGTFKFPAASVDPVANVLGFGGSVSFSAHEGQLAVKISEIRLDLDRGLLVADVVSKAITGEGMVTYDDVELTTLAAGGTLADGSASGTALATTLTTAGSPAFASNYAAGDAFDPLTFAVSYAVPVAAPVVSTSPTAQSVENGAPATFAAAATGHDSIQWQALAAGSGAWADLVGATGNSLTVTAAKADNGNQYRAAFTNAGGTVYSEAAVLTVTEDVVPEVPVFTPELRVFAADGVTPLSGPVVEGTKVVVKGSGFDPAANVAPEGSRPPIAAGNPAGVYVVFGKFADQWRPSENAPSSARVVGDQLWAMSQAALDAVPPAFQGAVRGQWVEVTAEGAFTATLTVKKKSVNGVDVEWPEAGNFGAYTYAAGGTKNAAQELYAPITVGNPASKPVLTVEPATGLKYDSKVMVSGSGYAANRAIYVAEVAQGPGGQDRPAVYERAQRVVSNDAGEFGPVEVSVTTVFENGGFTAVANKLYISTFNSPLEADNAGQDHSADRTQDAFVELGWSDPSAPADPEPEVPAEKPSLSFDATTVAVGKSVVLRGSGFTPGAKLAFDLDGNPIDVGVPTSADVTGGLDWGIKASFRSYLNGAIAKGTITTDGGATANADGTFHFPAASYDSVNKIAGYTGTVSMTGHDGALQVKLGNLRVDVAGKKLIADMSSKSLDGAATDYPSVALVSLDNDAVTSDGRGFAGNDLATTLTAAGAPAFADFYKAGDAFDALSFDIQAAATELPLTVGVDGTFGAQWAVPAAQKPGRYTLTATATAQAAEQARATAADAGTQAASATLEITAAVAEPKPTDPATPTVKPVPTADPEKLAGDAKCSNGKVVGGTLKWGVKESFRNYITGNIAKGNMTFNGSPADKDTIFTFTNGKGSIDAAKRSGSVTFDGVVSFQGHDYGSGAVLSVTMENVTLVMDGASGTLQADVKSRSLESATAGSKPGADVAYDNVVLAKLDLSKAGLNDAETVYAGSGVQASLAASGVAPFAGFYAAGDTLDPVTFALGCSEDASVDSVVGAASASSGTLAKTGAMGMDASVIGALIVLLLGAGVITGNRLVRRRRY